MDISGRLGLASAHRRWLIVNALAATLVINLILNTAIGWLQTRGHPHLPLWSVAVTHSSVIGDALGTLFILPLTTCLLVTAGVRRDQAHGRLPRLDWRPSAPLWVVLVQRRVLQRAVRFGAATFLALAVPFGVAVAVAFPHGLSERPFLVFHVVVTVTLGALVTPVIALAAMTDEGLLPKASLA